MQRLIILFAHNHLVIEADEQYIKEMLDTYQKGHSLERPLFNRFGDSAVWAWTHVVGMYVLPLTTISPQERIAAVMEKQVNEGESWRAE